MSSFWKIFISVVVTVAVVGGGTFYIMQKQIDSVRSDNQTQMDNLNKQIATLKSATVTSVSPTTTTTPATTDPTAGWKTYTSSAYGYSLKYPANWVTALDGKNLSLNSPENQAIKDKIDAGGMYGEGYAPTIMVQYFPTVSDFANIGNPQPKSTKSAYDSFKESALGNSLQEITLGGQKAYERESGGFSGTYYDIMCEYNSKVYDIQIVSEKKSLTATEKTILSTFQFTK